jgi:hypothetical protein
VQYLLICLAVTFPTVWFATGARGRYYMPLYPVVAILIGLVVDRCWRAEDTSSMRVGWQRFLVGMGGAMVVAAVVVAAADWLDHPTAAEIAQPPLFAACFLACGLAIATWLVRTRRRREAWVAQTSLLAIAAFLGLAYTGAVVNALARIMEDTAGAVARARSEIPEDTELVSLGIVDHKFRYHYREPIRVVSWPPTADVEEDHFEYFCFNASRSHDRQPPWPWEELAQVSLERNRRPCPRKSVVVGRRVLDRRRTAESDLPQWRR